MKGENLVERVMESIKALKNNEDQINNTGKKEEN